MKLELHILQNFAPSNLNRDDTGAPKDCEFGGHRRARISSQAQKRAVRQAFELDRLVDAENRGSRTKRLIHTLQEALQTDHGLAPEIAEKLAIGAIEGVGLKRQSGVGEDSWKTEYLLFVPRKVIGQMASILAARRDTLLAAPTDVGSAVTGNTGKTVKKDKKATASAAYPKDVRRELEVLLATAGDAVDVALFGRMIADKPDWNVEASCQVAQAISTNRVQMDFDFFTAVDDLKPRDSAGSEMMGTVQFTSSCFYRYSVLDIESLRKNLDGNEELTRRAVDAFVKGFVSAIPTGKQNGMAAHNFPSYVLAVVRQNGQPLSLANAFLKPARPGGDNVDLVDDSIEKLEAYAVRLKDVLGEAAWLTWADRDLPETDDAPQRLGKIGEFYTAVATSTAGRSS